MKEIQNNTMFTEAFLRCVSTHLSSREECKQLELVAIIDDSLHVKLLPQDYLIFPSRYKKKAINKIAVTEHVANEHFDNQVYSDRFSLVPGEYIYKLSVNKKQRRWQRKE